MQFVRQGSLDDRRRRVLTEEVIGAPGGGADTSAATASVPARSCAFTPHSENGDSMDREQRVIDLVPRHYGWYALWFAAGLAAVAGLEALYAWMPAWAAHTTDGRIAAFDLDGEGSLAVWFSSFTLLAAAVVALLVYSVRRHRADDYHGRYRIWLWAAGCWLVMSIDECGSLHEGFKELMTYATGRRIMGDGSIWWVGAYALVLGVVGTRLALDMRRCRASTTAFVLAGTAYAAAVLAQLGWIMPESGARGVMVEEGAEMVGNLLVLLAMTLHARHVILQSQGLLADEAAERSAPVRRRAANSRTDSSQAVGAGRWFGWIRAKPEAAAADKTVQRPAARATSATPTAKPAAESKTTGAYRLDDENEPAGDHRKLSKAQRRALRRQQRETYG